MHFAANFEHFEVDFVLDLIHFADFADLLVAVDFVPVESDFYLHFAPLQVIQPYFLEDLKDF